MKKKLIFLLHGPLTKREYQTFGINYLKKKFDFKVVEIGPLIDSRYYKFKRNFKFKIIKNFSELENFLSLNKEAICWESGFSFNSIRIGRLLKKYKIKTISADGIASVPIKTLGKNNLPKIILRRLKLLIYNPLIFFNRVLFFIKAKLRQLRYKKVDIALIGGESYEKYPGYENAEHKIYCASLDYSDYISKKKNELFKSKKKFAVFIDTCLPFHPEHYDTQNKYFDPKKYFDSLVAFFKLFEKITKLRVIVALYPKTDLKKYPKNFKKFKLVSNKIVELIRSCELVMHHGSTAQSYAIIFKKPALFLTSDTMEKNKYLYDNEKWNEFIGSDVINIDFDNSEFLKQKKVFKYNKKFYQDYLKNFLKYKSFSNKPWYKQLYNYFNK